MGITLTFEITLESDYHVGAGHGLDILVDSALHRDRDGSPVLRGSTLNGLLRDGLYRLLQLPPLQTASGPCQVCNAPMPSHAQGCPVCQVFGSPREAKHWRFGAARPVEARNPSVDSRDIPSDGHITPQVRVSPRTRRAEARKLFFRENGDAAWRFRFDVTCNVANEATVNEAAWLVAAARYVRHLGAGRRRGRGACQMHLVSVAGVEFPEGATEGEWQSWFLDRFAQVHLDDGETTTTPLSFPAPAAAVEAGAAGDATPMRIWVIVRLDEPLILSQKAEAGNEFHSLDYIPGSVLRGAFAGQVAARYDLMDYTSGAYAAFVRLFFRDGAQFPTLYPALLEGQTLYPSIPAPQDLFSCPVYPGFENNGHGVRSFAAKAELTEADWACPTCLEEFGGGHDPDNEKAQQPISVHFEALGGYWALVPNAPTRIELQHTTEMHLRVDPETQRAAEGNLFSYDALDSGQYFVGELLCAGANDWRNLQALTGLTEKTALTLRLGKANRRGYGQVTLWLEPRVEKATGAETATPDAANTTGDVEGQNFSTKSSLVMTLLTDAIILDPWGRGCAGFDEAWLSELFSTETCKVQAKILRVFCSAREVDAFNAHLGLPRWRDVALTAGSAVGFTTELDETQQEAFVARLQEIERDGIGMRRGEGFGRVTFDHPLYPGAQQTEHEAVGIDLDERPDLRIPSPAATAPQLLAQFRQEWEKYLVEDQDRMQSAGQDPFAHPELATLAHVVHNERPASLEALLNVWERLGRADSVLPSAFVAEELAAREMDRARLDFYRAEKGPGVAARCHWEALARELQTRVAECPAERAAAWDVGTVMLAERVFEAAQSQDSILTLAACKEKEATQ
ncbi:MAG: hypothetical protein JXA21_00175 [Anaerolineae bacterium]|nr:hypothetical protein [Anaerolineae bacterium]